MEKNQFLNRSKKVIPPFISLCLFGIATVSQVSTPLAEPLKSYPRPFLTDIANKISSLIQSNTNPDEIIRIVRRDVRVDQAVMCLSRDTNTSGNYYTRLHSRSDYNGVVTDESEKTLYSKMFTDQKIIDALSEANKGAPAGTTVRPTKIVPMFMTLNSSGIMQNFQVNISIIDKDHMCMARFSVPENTNINDNKNLIPPLSTPTTSNSFRESVALKIEEKISSSSGSTVDEIMQTAVKEVEVEEAVICMVRLGSSFFRLHSRPGNDGIISAAENADYQRFYDAIKTAILAKNAGWVEGGSTIASRPEFIEPLEYKLKNTAGVEQTFSIYPMVIDGTHFCFGRILQEVERKASTATDSSTASTNSTTTGSADTAKTS